LVNTLKVKEFTLYVHPYVEAYISKGVIPLKHKWKMKYGRGCNVRASQELGFLQYKFIDKKGMELNLQEEMKKFRNWTFLKNYKQKTAFWMLNSKAVFFTGMLNCIFD
jgi:hypothetical protein